MPRQLLSDALEQAERSEPVVRAAALLHIARVLNAFDHAEAERVLDRGIALAADLAEPDEELEGGLDRPIVDETHLGGTYALNVHSEALSTREFLHVLCDKLGLVVTPGRREISMLVARQG